MIVESTYIPESTTEELHALADTLRDILVYGDTTKITSQVVDYIQEDI